MALKKTKKKTTKKVEATEVKAAAPAPKPTPKPKAAPAPRVLTKGMSGDDVKKMQKVLGVEEDGFGFATLVALKKWQNVNGLKPDGIAGPVTQSKLR